MFNDPMILKSFAPVSSTTNCNSVKYKKLHSDVINMTFFDQLHEEDLVNPDGYIKKMMEEFYMGINLGDRLRHALYNEESEWYGILQQEKF